MASQFVVGIWEYQVGRLDAGLARDMEEYLPSLMNRRSGRRCRSFAPCRWAARLRRRMEVLAYETAEELVRAQKRFSVAPCICRKEKGLLGHTCDKPLEVCMAFGAGGRLLRAQRPGAVHHQRGGPGHSGPRR